jgi:hypothetical protein
MEESFADESFSKRWSSFQTEGVKISYFSDRCATKSRGLPRGGEALQPELRERDRPKEEEQRPLYIQT